jgi:hypothetical protein
MSTAVMKKAPAVRNGQVPSGAADWRTNPVAQAFWLLRIGFTVAPILFDWDRYMAPEFADVLPWTTHELMYAVGVIEIVAGLVVAVTPRFGGYLVAAWLGGIIVNLLMQADFYDIALRDFGLLLGALTLARLASVFRPGFTRA